MRLCRTAVGYFHLARHARVPWAGRGALKALRAQVSFIILAVLQDVPSSLGQQPTNDLLNIWLRHARAVWVTHAPSK